MKNIFKLGFFALLFTAISCEDATDIIQEGELNEGAAYKTVADLRSGLNGVYDSYAPDAGGNGAGDAVLFNDLFTDNMKRGKDGNGQGSSEFNFILQPGDTAPESIWASRYATIRLANIVLRAYDRLEPNFSGATLEQAKQVKAELLAFRALCHLDLFEYYTTDYKNPTALSVIKVDFVPNLPDDFERNTVAEITEFIQADLTQSLQLMGNYNVNEDTGAVLDKAYLSKYAVIAINARLANDMGNSALAISLVDQLDAMSGGADPGPFNLSARADYIAMFQDASNNAGDELIMKLKRLAVGDSRIGALYYANSVDTDGSPFLEASNQLYNLYSDNDVRRTTNFTADSNPAANLILIGKYPGTSTANQLVNDFKLFRLSEMLFIKAEAQARSGDLAGAQATISRIRVQREDITVTPNYANLTVALTDILLERRKELAFEGHRYLDLKRLGAELNIDVNRDQIDADSFAAPVFLSTDDYRFTFPIPRSEINANSIITQNPGYPVNN